MIKNYIFDFGQVIVHFNTEYMTSIYVDDSDDIKQVENIVFDRLYWDKLDAGAITDAEVKQCICSRLPSRLQKSACFVYDNWYKNLSFIDSMPELLNEIKNKGGRLYLLSNISSGFAENYSTIPEIKKVLDMFDGLVFSGSIGMIKPDKRIFEYILNKYSLIADETIFIDDNINNVLGAERAGIKGLLFNGNTEDLVSKLFDS